MKFDAPQAQIQLDGSFLDWQCADIKAQTPFYPYNQRANQEGSHCCGNKLTMFDDCTCHKNCFPLPAKKVVPALTNLLLRRRRAGCVGRFGPLRRDLLRLGSLHILCATTSRLIAKPFWFQA